MFTITGETINYEATLKLLGGKKDLLNDMLVMMQNSLTEEIAQLKQARTKNDGQLLREIIHKMKGAASYCGAERLRDLCRQIELQVMQTQELSDAAFLQLMDEIELFRAEYKNLSLG